MTGGRLAHKDGSRVIEGLDTHWALTFGSDPTDPRHTWLDAEAPVGGMLLLWGSLFGDYSKLESLARVRLESGPPASGWSGSARVILDEATEFHGSLHARPAEPLTYEASFRASGLPRGTEIKNVRPTTTVVTVGWRK